MSVATLIVRCDQGPPASLLERGLMATDPVSVGALLRREGRGPRSVDRPLTPRGHSRPPVEDPDPPRRNVRKAAAAAGALFVVGAMFGAAAVDEAVFTPDRDGDTPFGFGSATGTGGEPAGARASADLRGTGSRTDVHLAASVSDMVASFLSTGTPADPGAGQPLAAGATVHRGVPISPRGGVQPGAPAAGSVGGGSATGTTTPGTGPSGGAAPAMSFLDPVVAFPTVPWTGGEPSAPGTDPGGGTTPTPGAPAGPGAPAQPGEPGAPGQPGGPSGPGVTVPLPDVETPGVHVPGATLPDVPVVGPVTIPAVDVSEGRIDLPDVTVTTGGGAVKVSTSDAAVITPDVHVSDVDAGPVHLSRTRATLPDVGVSGGSITLAPGSLPAVDLPAVTVSPTELVTPDAEVDGVDAGIVKVSGTRATLPDVGISAAKVDLDPKAPEVTLPEVTVSPLELDTPDLQVGDVTLDTPDLRVPEVTVSLQKPGETVKSVGNAVGGVVGGLLGGGR